MWAKYWEQLSNFLNTLIASPNHKPLLKGIKLFNAAYLLPFWQASVGQGEHTEL